MTVVVYSFPNGALGQLKQSRILCRFNDAHPMKDPSEPVHRFLAGKHMILAGLLISQTRHASRECHEGDLSQLR